MRLTHTRTAAELLQIDRFSWRAVLEEWPHLDMSERRLSGHWHGCLKPKLLRKEFMQNLHQHGTSDEEVQIVHVVKEAVDVIDLISDDESEVGTRATRTKRRKITPDSSSEDEHETAITELLPVGVNQQPSIMKHLFKTTQVRTFVKNVVKSGEHHLRRILSRAAKHMRSSQNGEQIANLSDLVLFEAIEKYLQTFKKLVIEGEQVHLSAEASATQSSSMPTVMTTFPRASPQRFTGTTASVDGNAIYARGSVREWLNSASLSRYESVLLENGFDSLRRLALVESNDLDSMKFNMCDKRQFLSVQRSTLSRFMDFPPQETARISTNVGQLMDTCYAKDFALGLQEEGGDMSMTVRKTIEYVRSQHRGAFLGIPDSALSNIIRSWFTFERRIS